MKRKLGILVIVAIIALLPLTSCMSAPKASTPAAPVATEYDKSQDSSIASVKSQIEKEHQLISELQSNKLSKSEYTSSEAYPKTQTYTRSELYTRTEVDALLAKLKTELQGTTGTGGTGTTGGTTSGVVTFLLTRPTEPVMSSTAGGVTGGETAPAVVGTTTWYTMRVTNSSSAWQYVKPVINMSIASGYTMPRVFDLSVTMSGPQGSISQILNTYEWATVCSSSETCTHACDDSTTTNKGEVGNYTPGTKACQWSWWTPPTGTRQMTFSPENMMLVATPSIVIMPIAGGSNNLGEFQIGPGQSMDINISIAGMHTDNMAIWNVTNSLNVRQMY